MAATYRRKRKTTRRTSGDRMEKARAALASARNNPSMANYAAVIEGFADRGISPDEIDPKINVLPYAAWPALGRHVRKGEKSVQIVTFYPIEETQPDGTKKIVGRRPGTACVFHISQTDPDDQTEPAQEPAADPAADPAEHAPCESPDCEICAMPFCV